MKKTHSEIISIIQSPIGILLIAGFILRIILYFLFQPYNHLDEVIFQDSKEYHQLALQFFKSGNFIINNSTIDTLRTPGYPLFIWVIFVLFGIKVHLVLFAQIFLNLASVYILFLICGNLFNKKIGFLAALLLSLELDHLYFIYSLLTDTLFVFLLLLSTLYLTYFLKNEKPKYLILSTFIIGIATLVKPIGMFYPSVLLFILVIYTVRNKKRSFSYIIKNFTVILVLFCLTISPWLVRNYSLYDYFRLSTITGISLLNWNAAITIQNSEKRPMSEIRNELNSLAIKNETKENLDNPFYKSKVQGDLALDYIQKHKVEYLRSSLLGMINIYSSLGYKEFSHRFFRTLDYSPTMDTGGFYKFSTTSHRLNSLSPGVILTRIIFVIYLLFSYITALLGIILLLKQKRFVLVLFLISVIAFFTILIGIVGLARYKLPISPFYLMFSGYYISNFKLFKNIKL